MFNSWIKGLIKNNSNSKYTQQDIFVVIILARFGDALVGNGLFQNLKRLYPNSKTVCIINKPYYEVVKYQKDVDETIIFDKDGIHKGLFGMLRFVKNFPYKNIKCIFKESIKPRINILSTLLNPEKIINYNDDTSIPTHERYNNLLKKYTDKEILNLPIVYNATDDIPEKFSNIIYKTKNYIGLCPISSHIKKDMPIEAAFSLIKKLNEDNFKVILLGNGNRTVEYANELENKDSKFINLINQTTIYELAQVLRNCKCLISVDTGTMHLGYACNVPTVCLFNSNNIAGWAPCKHLYPHTEVIQSKNADDALCACKSLLGVK